MNFEIFQAKEEHRLSIKNLMQFYVYDFSEFIDLDVGADGLFEPYRDLEEYWKDPNSRFPYLIKKEGKYIGFVLVRFMNSAARKYFSMAEFFIMKKYRRAGIGKEVAFQVFKLHRGNWEIFQKETNHPAQQFWIKVINEFTLGKFTDRHENGKRIQEFVS